MLVLATLVMAIGAALQAAVGLGMALFVVPLLALIDVRLIPGPVLLASVALAVMMAYRGRAAINRRELTLSLVGLCMGTAVGAWGLSLVAPASLTKLFALLILVAVLVSLIGAGLRSAEVLCWRAAVPPASWARWLEFMARRSHWYFRTQSPRKRGRC